MSIDISVIIPTYNRKNKLKDCLDSLFAQDYPDEKVEWIVVDDGSDDKIHEMVNTLRAVKPNLKYFAQLRKGPAKARNLGVEVSLGDIIAFVDDDCVVDKSWVKLMVDFHQKNKYIAAVGGETLTSSNASSVLVSQFLSACSIESCVKNKSEVVFFPTCNVSLKRRLFDRYKFDENFPLPGGEDLEFFWRLFKEGYRFVYDKNIKVIHYRNDSFFSFIKQAYIYGRGNFLVQKIHRDHPLLKELKTDKLSFWSAITVNFIKIPRFSYLLGNKLIKKGEIKNSHKRFAIYLFFVLHKIFYILGNIWEFVGAGRKEIKKSKISYQIPRLIILDITHSCNLTCRICDIWKTKAINSDIDIRHIKNILMQVKALGVKEIALSGGEPLLRKDVFEIIGYAKEIKIKNLGILTNGILVKEYIERLKPYLLDNTISLVISLDSLNPDVHNHIRNYDFAWQQTIESLKELSYFKEKYPQINFNVITIILNNNLEELVELAVFIKSLGVNSLQFQPLLSNNLKMDEREKTSFWVTENRLHILNDMIDRLIEFKEENINFIKNSVGNLRFFKKYYPGVLTSDEVKCFSADRTILVSNGGECTTCFSCYGDIKKQSFNNILESRKRIEAKEKVTKCSWPCLLPCFCDV